MGGSAVAVFGVMVRMCRYMQHTVIVNSEAFTFLFRKWNASQLQRIREREVRHFPFSVREKPGTRIILCFGF